MKAVIYIRAALLALLMISFALIPAFATGNGSNHDEETVTATATSAANADASATATSTSTGGAGGEGGAASAVSGDATASNEGITVGGDTSNVENNSSNVVLVPHNNTESCVRVWGIAFGKDGSSGALGIPWRSARCDFEQAADDAFAAGERDLGWFWKCHNKSLYKQFQSKDESNESAIVDCHTRMLSSTRDDLMADLQKQVDAANERAEAAKNLADLERSHKKVCDEALGRCEEQAYGNK